MLIQTILMDPELPMALLALRFAAPTPASNSTTSTVVYLIAPASVALTGPQLDAQLSVLLLSVQVKFVLRTCNIA
jgi:hypothetical protein